MSTFDNRNNLALTADAPSYTAKITPGTYSWTATLSYKPGWKVGPPSVTAKDSDILMGELKRLDAAVRFYKTGNDSGTLSAVDAKALEAMRVDVVNVSDIQYRSACRQFKQPIGQRPIQAATGAAQAQQPVSIIDQLAAWPDFQREHGEIFQPPFGDSNVKIIAQYLMDEGNLPSTPANLATAYRELKAANCFRTANTLTRSMHGDLQIFQPYSHDRIVAARQQQATDAVNQPPAYLSDIEKDCWQAVRTKYQTLSVNSAAFQKTVRDTLVLWARQHCLEADPSLGATNAKGRLLKEGELNAAIQKVIGEWCRFKKQPLSQRLWLG